MESEIMTILQIFNRYQYRGGEEASVLRIADTLSERHNVVRCYFESVESSGCMAILTHLKAALLMLYNPASLKRIKQLIAEEKPDLILIHNVFPLCSATALLHLSRSRIPLVQVIHNFRPFSVNGYCWANGAICDSGLRQNFLPEIQAGAWQQSRLRTAWYAMVLCLLHRLGVYRRIKHWIAISEFMKDKFVEAGVPAANITPLRHSWFSGPEPKLYGAAAENESEPPYLLFLGRLSQEKGVDRMLDAWQSASAKSHQGRLLIAGSGPLEQMVRQKAERDPRIEFLGEVSGDAKTALLDGARAIVVPSCWWEPLGIVVYEAYDHGKPVLAAASGGLTETVIDGQTGMLHEPGDTAKLAEQMQLLLQDPVLAATMGRCGRQHLLSIADPERWAATIERTLEQVTRPANRVAALPSSSPQAPGTVCNQAPFSSTLRVATYLADQNPKLGRSLGISRMTEVVLDTLGQRSDVRILPIVSSSSIQGPRGCEEVKRIPWSTKNSLVRIMTDNLHPALIARSKRPDVWFYPKGFMPRLPGLCRPAVAMIHDTIIQFYQDKYPEWRTATEYGYWASMLRQTLAHATEVMTVSQHSKRQIESFIDRHQLPKRPIHVTYEPCSYESVPQPDNPAKADHILHLASREPHKRTAWLVDLWIRESRGARELPKLHVVGTLPDEVREAADHCPAIVHFPFLEDPALISQFMSAKALIFPSEIEGFGLPAIEAYYLGTPVCYTQGTSMEEILQPATAKGGFDLKDDASFWDALDCSLAMTPEEIRQVGLQLRETYAAATVAERIMAAFRTAAGHEQDGIKIAS